jgi:chromosome segregation ATPase
MAKKPATDWGSVARSAQERAHSAERLLERAENAEADLIRTQIEMQLEIDKAEAEVERLREDNQKLRARLNYVQGCDCDNYLHPYCNKLTK